MLGAIIRMLVLLCALGALQGCERRLDAVAAWRPHEAGMLRLRQDLQRERLWVLTHEGVSVYSTRTRQRVQQVSLPGWHWAGEPYSCGPDLALSPEGDALVTSDSAPSLWRVDGSSLRVTQHELQLSADAHMDIGFSGLAYSPERRAYVAVSYVGSLWVVGPQLREARKVALSEPVIGACGIAVRPALCVRGELTDWVVELTADARAGRVRATPHCGAGGGGAWRRG